MPAGNRCTAGFSAAVFLNLFRTDALQGSLCNWHCFSSILFQAPTRGMTGKAGCGYGLWWDKADPPPPQQHRGCSQQSHTRRKEQQVWYVPGRHCGAMWQGTAWSSGSSIPVTALISSAGAKRAPGSNTSFLPE